MVTNNGKGGGGGGYNTRGRGGGGASEVLPYKKGTEKVLKVPKVGVGGWDEMFCRSVGTLILCDFCYFRSQRATKIT